MWAPPSPQVQWLQMKATIACDGHQRARRALPTVGAGTEPRGHRTPRARASPGPGSFSQGLPMLQPTEAGLGSERHGPRGR